MITNRWTALVLITALSIGAVATAQDSTATNNDKGNNDNPGGHAAGVAAMTVDGLIGTIWEIGQDVQEEGNVVRFTFADVPVVLVYDELANRMRLICPIAQLNELDNGQLEAAMEANFHSMLDVRYAVSGGVMWSAFLHPLSDLSDDLLRSAIKQVVVSKLTFGDTYTSGEMVFRGGGR